MSPVHPPLDPDERDWSVLGLRASPQEVVPYRDDLKRSPDDLQLRTIVANHVAPRAVFGDAVDETLEHLEWFAAHRPASRTMCVLCAMLAHVTDPRVRARADAILTALVDRAPSATVLGNVARYFQLLERERARCLLERAKALEPDRAAQWTEQARLLDDEPVWLHPRGRAVTESAIGRGLPSDFRELSGDDLDALEQRLVDWPADLFARQTLASAYAFSYLQAARADAPEAAGLLARTAAHVGWLIENAPGAKETAEAPNHLWRRADQGLAELSALWERALRAHPTDARVHANAAGFYRSADPDRAAELLERAAQLEPDEPEWSRRIAQESERRSRRSSPAESARHRQRAYLELERAAAHETLRYAGGEADGARLGVARRFALPKLAKAALAAGELARAEQIARELAESTPDPEWTRPFDGRAHEGHLVLGLLALRRSDVAAAARHLRTAADSPFPFRAGWEERTALARELFDAGERESVRAYLAASLRDAEKVAARHADSAEVAAFTGRDEIAAWLAALDAGERPAFPRDDA